MTRYRLALIETPDSGPDTVDADDLRHSVSATSGDQSLLRVLETIAVVLPKPRIVVVPGLRYRYIMAGAIFFARDNGTLVAKAADYTDEPYDHRGLDPARWAAVDTIPADPRSFSVPHRFESDPDKVFTCRHCGTHQSNPHYHVQEDWSI